jgi:hypothetical protein
MDWELKKQMAELADKNKEEFQRFVLEHINDFDTQAWGIFIESISIIPDEMKEDIDFWDVVNIAINKSEETIREGDIRTLIRVAIIQSICEDELGLKRPDNNS